MQLDDITYRAQADLTLVGAHGDEDPFLWEYSRCVAQNALSIAAIPSIRSQQPDDQVVYESRGRSDSE